MVPCTKTSDGFGSPAQATAEAKSCKAEIEELQEQLAAEKAGSGAFWSGENGGNTGAKS